MSEEKDWFEEIKRKHEKYKLSGTVTEYHAFSLLINEVEKLRKERDNLRNGLNDWKYGYGKLEAELKVLKGF